MQQEWLHYEIASRHDGSVIRARINKISSKNSEPIVIMLTGDGPKGTKSLSWTNLPPILSGRGIRTFLFDFQGLGYSDGDRKSLTLDRAINNLTDVYSFLRNIVEGSDVKTGVIASSFGATALLCLPEIANKLDAIVLKSPASFLADAYASELTYSELVNWVDNGFCEKNGYNIQVLIDALLRNPYETASMIKTPCLITHGTHDDVVPPRQSEMLRLVMKGEVVIHRFEGVGHGYSENNSWDVMAKIYVNWLSSILL